MRRKILAFICAVVVFMLLWIIFLIPIKVGFLFLVGIVSGLLEYEILEDATIMFWETIARFLTTLLSGYISYKIYQKISIDNFNLKTIKTKNILFVLLLILFILILNNVLFGKFFT